MQESTSWVSEGRIATAGLCLAVALIHVTDQGGFKVLDDPTWLGWAYRALEVGAVVVALVVLSGLLAPRLAALAVFVVGAGPLIGFVLTRTTGLPQDSDDIGNWGEPLGILSLVVEATLIVTALVLVARSNVRTPVAATGAQLAGAHR